MAVGLDKALLPVCHTTTAWGRVTFDMPRQLCHGQFMAMAHRIHLTRRVVSSRSSTSLVDCCPWSSLCSSGSLCRPFQTLLEVDVEDEDF